MIIILLLASSIFRLILANPEMSTIANQENCIVLSASCGTSSENKWHKNPIVVTVPPFKTVIQAYDVEKFCIDNNYNQIFQQSFCPADTSVPKCYTVFTKFSQTSPSISKFWRIEWSATIGGIVHNAFHRTKLNFFWDTISQSFVYSSTRYDKASDSYCTV